MSWNSGPLRRLGRSLPGHLSDLADRLRDIAERVRATVASVVGDAVARAVQDGEARFARKLSPGLARVELVRFLQARDHRAAQVP